MDPVRTTMAMARDPLGFVLSLARRYGDVAYVRLGPEPFYLLSYPDHVRAVLVDEQHAFRKSRVLQEARRVLGDGLLTSEGEVHRRQRRMIQPVFHHRRIAGYGTVMAEETAALSDRWGDGQEIDVHEEMMGLTLAIVGRTLFGSGVGEATAAQVARGLEDALAVYEWFLLPFSSVIERLPTPGMRRFHAALASLDEVVYGMIAGRHRTGGGDDLLSMLLSARDALNGDRAMTDRQVRDEAMTLFLAGHETTANALTWAWYLLSQHPDVAATMEREVDRVLGEEAPSVDHLPELTYTRMVMSETMRLYPPSWGMGRRVLSDVEIGGWGIPAGASVMVSQWVIHHDPRWFPDPFRFDPERWTTGAVAARPRHAYFPFGAGSRICIGEDFAWMEEILVLAGLARKWSLRLVPGHPVALQPRITLRPRGQLRMTLQRRPT